MRVYWCEQLVLPRRWVLVLKSEQCLRALREVVTIRLLRLARPLRQNLRLQPVHLQRLVPARRQELELGSPIPSAELSLLGMGQLLKVRPELP